MKKIANTFAVTGIVGKTEEDGTVRNRVILVANKFYPTPEKEDKKKGK